MFSQAQDFFFRSSYQIRLLFQPCPKNKNPKLIATVIDFNLALSISSKGDFGGQQHMPLNHSFGVCLALKQKRTLALRLRRLQPNPFLITSLFSEPLRLRHPRLLKLLRVLFCFRHHGSHCSFLFLCRSFQLFISDFPNRYLISLLINHHCHCR